MSEYQGYEDRLSAQHSMRIGDPFGLQVGWLGWKNMGKTVPTYRNQLEMEIRELLPFRRALREGEQALFDTLVNYARTHAAEGSFTAHSDPLVPFFLSILLEQERKIRMLERALQELVEDGE